MFSASCSLGFRLNDLASVSRIEYEPFKVLFTKDVRDPALPPGGTDKAMSSFIMQMPCALGSEVAQEPSMCRVPEVVDVVGLQILT